MLPDKPTTLEKLATAGFALASLPGVATIYYGAYQIVAHDSVGYSRLDSSNPLDYAMMFLAATPIAVGAGVLSSVLISSAVYETYECARALGKFGCWTVRGSYRLARDGVKSIANRTSENLPRA